MGQSAPEEAPEILLMPVEGSAATELAEDAQEEVATPQPVEVAVPVRPDLDTVRRREMTRAVAES